MHGPGRVGGHVLDVQRGAAAEVDAAIALRIPQDGAHDRVPRVRGEPQVHETGPRDLRCIDARSFGQPFRERHPQVPWLHPERLGEDERGIGGEIAVRFVLRRFDHEPRELLGTQGYVSVLRDILQCSRNVFSHDVEDIHEARSFSMGRLAAPPKKRSYC